MIEFLSTEEQWDIFDKISMREMGMTGQQFADLWNAGELDFSHTRDNHTKIVRVAFSAPNGVLE